MLNLLRLAAMFAAFFLLTGCRSVEGVYLPGCVAYAGDTIEVIDGRFEWDKFTDQVIVDKDDKIVDQFPDYPVAGTYTINEDTVSFVAGDGRSFPNMHLATVNGRVFLLTGEQHAAFLAGNEIADCALVLGHDEKR